ncbi:glycosyltransferase [Umezakia ovalisporum]|uniref:glycosyltransferase n=1 Tax=Umezakia ovalisporum TaxID=75695 RepID=UPI0035B85448
MIKKVFILEPSLKGHAGNFTKILAQEFSEAHNVTIALYEDEFNQEFLHKYKETLKNTNFYFLPRFFEKLPNSLLKKFIYVLKKFIYIIFLLIKFRPDVIMLPSIDGMVYLALVFKPIIWLLSPRLQVFGFLASYKYFYVNLPKVKKWLFEQGITCFNRVIINDEFFNNYLVQRGYSNARYINDPVEDISFPESCEQLRHKWDFPRDSLLIGMTGGIDYRKGADIIVKVSQELQREKVHFVLAGSVYSDIREILDKGQNDKLIVIDRFLDIEEMHEIISCFDLVLLPYRNYHFGIASILLRAIACNKPSLVSAFGWLERMASLYPANIFTFNSYEDLLQQLRTVDKKLLHQTDCSIVKDKYIYQSINKFSQAWRFD